jgi:hypothetical protein
MGIAVIGLDSIGWAKACHYKRFSLVSGWAWSMPARKELKYSLKLTKKIVRKESSRGFVCWWREQERATERERQSERQSESDRARARARSPIHEPSREQERQRQSESESESESETKRETKRAPRCRDRSCECSRS